MTINIHGMEVANRGALHNPESLDFYMELQEHDVVDGAPATRFVSRLVELIEGGYGLI